MRTSSTGGRLLLLLLHVVMVLVITTALSGAFAMRFIPPVKNLPSELGGSSGSSSSSSSLNLYGIKGKCDWVLSKVNITRVAPQTGHVLNTVFDTSHFCQPTVTVPATDPKSKTAFLVGYHRYSSFDAWDTPVLSVLDFTNPDRPAEVQKIALPASSSVFVSYTYSNVHYDPVGNNAWVIAQTIDQVDPFDNDQFLIRVDLTQGVAYNVTSLPIATYNTQGALNVKTRKLYIPLGLGMIEYNIDTNSLAFWNSYITIMAMGWDSWTSATYALYVREDSKGQNVTYGILEPNTGALQDIKQYSSEYSSSGTMVVDSTAGLSYVALSTGQRQDFVVFETQSGNVRSLTAVPPDDAMNQYLFGL